MTAKAVRTNKELLEAARTCLADATFSPAKAGELLSRAVEQDPSYVPALVLRANLASRVGHLAAAVADLSLAIEVDRGSSDGRRLASLYGSRAALLARLGRHPDAVADLQAALKTEPDNGMWSFELGRAYLKDGRVRLAQLNLQHALQEPMWSRVGDATRPKVYALYGRSCLMCGEYKKAKGLLHKALEAGGQGAAVLHDVGLAHYYEGTAPAIAIDFFTRATELDHACVAFPTHLSLTQACCGGTYTDALSSINEAVLRDPQEPLLPFYRGCIELQLGLGPSALTDLQASAQTRRDHESTGAEIVKRTKRLKSTALQAASVGVSRAWIAMALVHIFCEVALHDAVRCLQEALRHTPEPPLHALAGLLLGVVLHRQGDTTGALRALTDVLQVSQHCARGAATTAAAAVNADSATATSAESRPSPSASAHERLWSNVELLTLTHMGLAYTAGGYADLALRYFTQARCRAEACNGSSDSGDTPLPPFYYREAVAQVALRDYYGALQTLEAFLQPQEMKWTKGKEGCPGVAAGGRVGTSVAATATSTSPASSVTAAATTAVTSSAPVYESSANTTGAPHAPSVSHPLPAGEALHVYAVTLRRLGRLSEALRCATAAVEAQRAAAAAAEDAAVRAITTSHPAGVYEVPAYLYSRALTYFSCGQYAEAAADVQACVRAYARTERAAAAGSAAEAIPADVYYLKARLAHAGGAFAEALEDASTALRLDPSLRATPAFSYGHGVLLAIAGQHRDAIAAFSAAITHAGGDSDDSALPTLRVAAAHRMPSPSCPFVYFHERAKAYQQLGHYAEALVDYNRVLPPVLPTAHALAGSGAAPASGVEGVAAVNWNALVNRALTLKELQRYDAAARDWDAALRLDTSALLAQFTTQDVFALSYLPLCQPGCEHYAASSVV